MSRPYNSPRRKLFHGRSCYSCHADTFTGWNIEVPTANLPKVCCSHLVLHTRPNASKCIRETHHMLTYTLTLPTKWRAQPSINMIWMHSEGGTAPHILNLSTRRTCAVNITTRRLPSYTRCMWASLDVLKETKSLARTGIRRPGRSGRSLSV